MFTQFETIPPERLRREFAAKAMPPSIGTQLDAAAQRWGERPALSFFDQGVDFTWRGLQAEVARAAAALRALGVGKGSHVAVLLPNVPAFPLAWLALGRLGAVMIPVNITYTSREVEYVLTDGQAEFLVVHADLLPAFEDIAVRPVPPARVVTVGTAQPGYAHRWEEMLAAASASEAVYAAVGPQDLINIQYTSGTTGFPKGCMLSHRYWLDIGYVMLGMWAAPMERLYGGANFYYMLLQRILMNAMHSGACMFVPRRPSARDFMAQVRATGAHYAALFEAVYKQPPHPDDARNDLRLVNIFGMTKANHADFQRRFDVAGQDVYGMTETGHITYVPAHEILPRTGTGTCGVVAQGREVRLTRPDGTEAGPGEEGELCVRGASILQGYWNKPEANADSFRGEWFRTGDLARVDSDGFHYIVGRLKEMIRRQGENISAREVEAVMRLLPQVRDAAAVPVPDPVRDEEVKLYLQLQPGLGPDDLPPERVIAHARAQLAPFKVPRYLEYREELPRTVESDRVEKKKLIAEKPDLRVGAYDRQDGVWR